jgi:hypothetical protein
MVYDGYIAVNFKNCFLIGLLQAHRAGAIVLPSNIFDLLQNNLFIKDNKPPSLDLDLDYLLTLYNLYITNSSTP